MVFTKSSRARGMPLFKAFKYAPLHGAKESLFINFQNLLSNEL